MSNRPTSTQIAASDRATTPFSILTTVLPLILILFFVFISSLQSQEPSTNFPSLPPEYQEVLERSRTAIPNFSEPQDANFTEPDISEPEWRARPLVFSSSEEGVVVDIEILLWGNEASAQGFTLELETQPPFIQNLTFDKTRIELTPENWSSELELAFDISSPNTSQADAKQSGEIVFNITADDKTLIPSNRKFVLPIRFKSVGDRSIFVTTTRADYSDNPDLYEAHLECVREEIQLFTIDPFFIFFQGFPKDQRFFYKLIDPDGQEVETAPYWPGEKDGGRMIYAAEEGAISPMYRGFTEFEWDSFAAVPWKSGEYIVQASFLEADRSSAFGTLTSFGEYQEVGRFTLVDPVLKLQGTVAVEEKIDKPQVGVMNYSAGGTSASFDAQWTVNQNNQKKSMGASGSLTMDYPSEIAWGRDKRLHPAEVSLSSSTFGQEGERVIKHLGLGFVRGFIVSENLSKLTELDDRGRLKFQKELAAIRNFERPTGTYYGDFNFEIQLPNPMHPIGSPQQSLGWHLRSPNALFGILHVVRVTPSVIGGINDAQFITVYGLDSTQIGESRVRSDLPENESIAELESISEDEPLFPESLTQTPPESYSEPEYSDPLDQIPDFPGIPLPQEASVAASPVPGYSPGPPEPERLERPVERIRIPVSTSQGPARSQGGTSSQNRQLEEALVADNPDQVPSNHPIVAAFIANWISQAEPPANRDPNVQLRYNEWGYVEGKTTGGIITQNAKPDHAAGLSSSEFLWNHQRDLDSLDHCQLGQWVMARLRDEGSLNCSGRFADAAGKAVPQLVGKTIDQAEQQVVSEGLIPLIAIGPPAPEPSLEGSISNQDPPFGSLIEKGGAIELEIYTNYVGSATTPDLEGLSIDEAERILQENGFQLSLQLGDPAPTADLSERIQKQEPRAGASIAEGATVAIWLYDQYIHIPRVPELVGLDRSQAAQLIEEQGLVIDLSMSDPAQSEEDEGKVLSQEPEPGLQLNEGDLVKVWIHAPFVPKPTTPDLIGLDYESALQTTSSAGLQLRESLGDPAPSADLAGIIQTQSPRPGVEIETGATISIELFGNYIATAVLPNLVGMSANEAELLLLENGILMRRIAGPAADSFEQVFTIQAQDPPAGSEIELLTEVQVVIYDKPAPSSSSWSPSSYSRPSKPADSFTFDPFGQSEPEGPQPSTSTQFAQNAITLPPQISGIRLWNGQGSGPDAQSARKLGALTQTHNPRPTNGWGFDLDSTQKVHGIKAFYGIPGSDQTIAIGLVWEEPGDNRSEDIVCGMPYESEAFWDSEDVRIGSFTSADKRARAFFIAPKQFESSCKKVIAQLLPQAEQFARPGP
ncbi:MAG: PASTA domain-containing protein [Verrucomicrobiota bacterium]